MTGGCLGSEFLFPGNKAQVGKVISGVNWYEKWGKKNDVQIDGYVGKCVLFLEKYVKMMRISENC